MTVEVTENGLTQNRKVKNVEITTYEQNEQRHGVKGYMIGEHPGKTANVRYVPTGMERSLGLIASGPGWYYQMSTDPAAVLRGPYDTKTDVEDAVCKWMTR